ncbi:hypothetical protein AB0B89_35815 [Sphaerisporangium sp. NPDC049002]|uniref:hypothetical protein n=1 Tax=Sphaerisporangium sp. NPDC049002 TaxID=3155392 RepID=UPI0033C8E4BE
MSGTTLTVTPSFADLVAGSSNQTLSNAYAYGLAVGRHPGTFQDRDALLVLVAGLEVSGDWGLLGVMAAINEELTGRGVDVHDIEPTEDMFVVDPLVSATITLAGSTLREALALADLGEVEVTGGVNPVGVEEVRLVFARGDSACVPLVFMRAVRTLLGDDLGDTLGRRLTMEAGDGVTTLHLTYVHLAG